MSKVNVQLEESFIATGRLHELLSRNFSVVAKFQQSWGKVFNTKSYQRKVAHQEVIAQRTRYEIRKIIKQNDLDWPSWKVDMIGSMNLFDVMARQNQKYRIRKAPLK